MGISQTELITLSPTSPTFPSFSYSAGFSALIPTMDISLCFIDYNICAHM